MTWWDLEKSFKCKNLAKNEEKFLFFVPHLLVIPYKLCYKPRLVFLLNFWRVQTISESALFLPSKLIFFTNFCGTVLEMWYYIRARVSNRACTVYYWKHIWNNSGSVLMAIKWENKVSKGNFFHFCKLNWYSPKCLHIDLAPGHNK